MEYIAVIVAAIAAFAFGAVWYMTLSKPWMAAAGVSEEQQQNAGPLPYIISLVGAVLVAGMMRHIFAGSGIDTPMKGLISGLGFGLFLTSPWLATHYAFSGKPRNLFVIDAGYQIGGCAVIGLVLTLF